MQGGLTLDPSQVERFRADLARLCDPERDRVLVAVSGGADSLALLLLTHAVLGGRCTAATVDHGQRPEAMEEARYVARLCAERGIAHTTLAVHHLRPVELERNLSAALRRLRYAALRSELQEQGAKWLATAHHADDQLETVLMRLNRGAGTGGLAGVRARHGATIRPLLSWRRSELEAVVHAAGLTPVIDPTNVDDRFDRARLRKAIAGVDWLDPVRTAQSAAALGDAEEALAWAAQALEARTCTFCSPQAVELRPKDVPFELRRRLMQRCLRHIRPKAELRGGQVAALVRQLEQVGQGVLADVRCEAKETLDGPIWRLDALPPRRTG